MGTRMVLAHVNEDYTRQHLHSSICYYFIQFLIVDCMSLTLENPRENLSTHGSTVTIYGIQYTVYSIQYTVYSIHLYTYTVYSIQYTVYSIQYTVYSIQYTVYSIQYTVYAHYSSKYYLYYNLCFKLYFQDRFNRDTFTKQIVRFLVST